MLPAEEAISLNRRQARARRRRPPTALAAAAECAIIVLIAEELRLARAAFDRLTGRAGVEDVLDACSAASAWAK